MHGRAIAVLRVETWAMPCPNARLLRRLHSSKVHNGEREVRRRIHTRWKVISISGSRALIVHRSLFSVSVSLPLRLFLLLARMRASVDYGLRAQSSCR